MTITVKFRCDGCFKEANGTASLRRRTVEGVTPEGWVAFDSTIGACYCPECLAEIEAPETDETALGTG